MLAKFMIDSGLIYRTLNDYTLEELPRLLQEGYIEISEEDYELYATLDYVYDFESGKPKKLPIYETPIDELKSQKLQEVDNWTAAKITGGFVSSCTGAPVRYDSDKDTQLTMQGIALNVDTALFAEKYPDGCPIRGYAEGANTKSVFMLTPEQVMRWQADLSIHIGDCKQAGWAKQAEVQAAQSKEDLEAIIL